MDQTWWFWVWDTVPASLQEAALDPPLAAGGASEKIRGAQRAMLGRASDAASEVHDRPRCLWLVFRQ